MKSPRLQLALITLLALALRVIQLDAQPLWWDEGYSIFFATRAFGEMLARTAVDIHPPLYYAYLEFWMTLFGQASLILRLSSVVAGVLAIPLAYWSFRPIVSRRVALVTSLILALSPFHIFYSQEVRMYGLLTLAALASFGFLVRLIRATIPAVKPGSGTSQIAKPRVTHWLLFVIFSAAALYIEYFGVFIIGAEILIVLYSLYASRRAENPAPVLRRWVFAFASVLVLYLPWMIYAAGKLSTYVANKQGIEQYRALDLVTFLADHLIAFSVGHSVGTTWPGWLGAAVCLVIILLGIIYSRAQSPTRIDHSPPGLSPVLLLVSVLLFAYALNIVYPFHPARYERLLLFTAPFFYLLISNYFFILAGWKRLFAYSGFAILLGVMIIAGVQFYSTPRYVDEDYRGVIKMMRERASSSDAIIAVYPWQIGYIEAYWQAHPTLIEAPGDEWARDSARRDRDLRGIDSQFTRVWLMAYQTQGRILEAQIANFFAADYLLTDEWFGNTRLELFGRENDPPVTQNAVPFQENVTLAGFGLSPAHATAGRDFERVYLRWQTNSNAFAYSLRLVDANGQTVAQQDAPIYSDPPDQRRGFFIPSGAAKGAYAIRLVVYRTQDGKPVNTLDGQESVRVGSLLVE